MSKRSNILLLEDILDSIQKIFSYTNELTFDLFVTDSKTIDAVVRNFEIIGEAANRLNLEFRQANSNINWNHIRGFRNRIVHEYFGIDYSIVWAIIESDLENLNIQIKQVYNGIKNK